MEEILKITALILDIAAIIAIFTAVLVKLRKIANGIKCQHRSDMLSTYYRHKEEKKIRQYEYENFIFHYESYKALKGNSFIDKIYSEVKEWEIIT